MRKRKLIAGNWKMNGTLEANEALLRAVAAGINEVACQVVVCVPAPYLASAVLATAAVVVAGTVAPAAVLIGRPAIEAIEAPA